MKKTAFFAYDTLCAVSIVCEDSGNALEILGKAEEIAREVETTLSMYDPNSELARLCAAYQPGEPYGVSPMLYDFLRLNLEFAEQSGGVFDPTVGPLVKLWNFLADNPAVPDEEQIQQMLRRVGYRHVRLLPDELAVLIDIPSVILDPGASGKGYALELVANYLKDRGVAQAVLDFGGNLYVMGEKPPQDGQGGQCWRVGIRHPEQNDYIGTVALEGKGIATSSWYEHSFQKDGELCHHLLNPRTGKPQPLEISSVSILSSQAVYTDLVSTAFFILGMEGGRKLAERLLQEQGVDIDYVAVLGDGSLCASPGARFAPKRA